jgi:hypothetical protein
MDSLKKDSIGGNHKRLETRRGCLKITQNKIEVRERLQNSLESQTRRFCFGLGGTAYRGEPCQKQEASSIGAQRVSTTQCGINAENSIRDGSGASRLIASYYTQALIGEKRVCLCGKEIKQRVVDAECTRTILPTCRFTSTMSFLLQTRRFALMRLILFCFVSHATTLSIHGGM